MGADEQTPKAVAQKTYPRQVKARTPLSRYIISLYADPKKYGHFLVMPIFCIFNISRTFIKR